MSQGGISYSTIIRSWKQECLRNIRLEVLLLSGRMYIRVNIDYRVLSSLDSLQPWKCKPCVCMYQFEKRPILLLCRYRYCLLGIQSVKLDSIYVYIHEYYKFTIAMVLENKYTVDITIM